MENSTSLADRCKAIELLVIDVDGVLTDGGIVYTGDYGEIKQFHVRDGLGLRLWHQVGKRSAIITGRSSATVARRATELGIAPVIQGSADKLEGFRRILADTGMRAEQTCCIGDDLPDLPLVRNCGLGVAVADAWLGLLPDAHYVTRRPGGKGGVREVVELILGCQGHWQTLVERLRQQRL
jgi:3-deoxy-D-manno-octulosonate 8-phosphate phosphatase (KDO 8-P phosphatase)